MIRTRTLTIAGALLLVSFVGTVHAEPEVIDLVPVPVTEPQAIPDPRPVMVVRHDLDSKDVEKLARLLWSSPLRDRDAKKDLVWVVLNRAAYGNPFGTSIQDCIDKHEFAFFDSHAHRSEENLQIVREAMDEWLSYTEGYNPGTVIPRCAFYIRFTGQDNRQIQLLDINKNKLG